MYFLLGDQELFPHVVLDCVSVLVFFFCKFRKLR